jgi:hypothetical protein
VSEHRLGTGRAQGLRSSTHGVEIPHGQFRDILCAPVNLDRIHWVTVAVDRPARLVHVCDFCCKRWEPIHQHICEVFARWCNHAAGHDLGWRPNCHDCRSQKDGHTCGVWSILVQWLILRHQRQPTDAEVAELMPNTAAVEEARVWLQLRVINSCNRICTRIFACDSSLTGFGVPQF